jgi:hypothetical protein
MLETERVLGRSDGRRGARIACLTRDRNYAPRRDGKRHQVQVRGVDS